MSDEVVKELQKVSRDLVKLESRVDNLQQTIQTELQPLNRLFQGNGKPSLEARLYHVEHEVKEQSQTTSWAFKTALGAALGALVTVVLSLVNA
tara:strand:- start:1004 stop:1282 length:279 start_codon:yes stop_codon:yes gene_type:complete